MAKYGDLIRKAREGEKQEGSKPDNQISVKPDDQSSERSKITSQSQENKPDDQINQLPEREVNLCVKVPESLRRHWAAEAKRHGITMTEVMTEALIQQFGKPDNQQTR